MITDANNTLPQRIMASLLKASHAREDRLERRALIEINDGYFTFSWFPTVVRT
jgi:hypothetical protein